jgi:hypothetical protein
MLIATSDREALSAPPGSISFLLSGLGGNFPRVLHKCEETNPNMAQTNANLIWKIADLLRGPYQPNQYGELHAAPSVRSTTPRTPPPRTG